MAPKNFLDSMTIPSPCDADWDSMIGNDQMRFCEHCNLDVHNISSMTRTQAQRLVSRSNGRLCVRYHSDSTGQPLTLPLIQKLHRINRRVSRIAAGAFTASLSITSAVAQNSSSRYIPRPPEAVQINPQLLTGSVLAGTVKDPNGAVIPGATVFLSNEARGIALYASTGSDGQFRIENLEAGVYQLRIEAPGFEAQQSDGIYVQANDESRVDRTLSIAGIEEKVDVQSFSGGGAVAFVAPKDPFVRAAQEDDLEALTALIAGVDVNVRDELTGTTALEHAVKNANREVVQLLLAAGANVNAKNSAGETVLMMLDEDATSEMVWDLINAGANVKLKDDCDSTALMHIAQSNNPDTIRTLLDAGAEINAKDEEGKTALMLAAEEGLVNNVRALVLGGADINVVDKEGMNALGHAMDGDHAVVVRFLKSKGAVEIVVPEEKDQ